uniref:Alpha N-terminal protein methyltransferase 1 n=1 Tax=Physcomitrium patens TaxID=3218 RepID=A0A2K1IMT1_PHYPA|nr:hypothetical protein PHYPA_026896 [Physcomitrium patens]
MRACVLKSPSGGFSWSLPRRDLKRLEQGQGRVALLSGRSAASQRALSVSCSFYFDMEESGLDTEGKVYANRKQMWEEEAGEDAAGNPKNAHKKQEWYHKGVSYWEGVEASVDGVLGGYGNVNDRDVMDSKAFLAEIFKECPPSSSSNLVALDCGAGAGGLRRTSLFIISKSDNPRWTLLSLSAIFWKRLERTLAEGQRETELNSPLKQGATMSFGCNGALVI